MPTHLTRNLCGPQILVCVIRFLCHPSLIHTQDPEDLKLNFVLSGFLYNGFRVTEVILSHFKLTWFAVYSVESSLCVSQSRQIGKKYQNDKSIHGELEEETISTISISDKKQSALKVFISTISSNGDSRLVP